MTFHGLEFRAVNLRWCEGRRSDLARLRSFPERDPKIHSNILEKAEFILTLELRRLKLQRVVRR